MIVLDLPGRKPCHRQEDSLWTDIFPLGVISTSGSWHKSAIYHRASL